MQIKKPTCELKEENRAALEKHLLEQFASSTFNNCENQKLPTMTGKPVKIMIQEDANPVFQKGGTIPVHLEEDMKVGLDRDISLGVIEKLLVNTPTD